MTAGSRVTPAAAGPPAHASAVVCDGLVYRFGSHVAVDEVDALRNLLIGTPASLPVDVTVLAGATLAGITVSALLLPRLAR